ncbi:MAG: hypothetical protein RLZZ417_2744 [Bacteroidota bacterium]|jgi:hypothetical protein
MKEINLEHLYALPVFELSFKQERFKNEVEVFLSHVNKCVSKNVREIIGDLLKCACEYKLEIPLYKTIFLDLAWAVLENNRALWSKEEKLNGYSDIDLHWHLYPQYDGSFDDYESIALNPNDYFEGVIELMSQEDLSCRDEVCFALYVFFVQSR